MKLITCSAMLLLAATAHAAEPVSFDRDVLPLLERRCNKCHHDEEQSGGLDLTRLATMHRGGDELGAAIVPGEPDKSPLVQVLTGAKEPAMPENGDPLPAEEIELLRRWITEGAKDDTPVFPADDVAFFEREIRPVLAERCFKCHAGDEPEHGLRLTSRQGILGGGARGSAATVGKPDESLLIKAVRQEGELQMPRGGDKLSDAQVAAFETWVAKGLPWPADRKVLAREKQFTISDSDRKHWAFRPLPKDLPTDWNIDATLKLHHERLGLNPSQPADKYRLLRRVTYDLIGYPPTPEEIAAFVQDSSPGAYDKVVARLLESPQYGLRWGRHWQDYTRNGANGQSNRGPGFDSERYSEWVAECFNEDRPWDWFARVHLAGDKMPALDGGDYSIDQALAAVVPLNGQRTFEEIGTDTFVLMDKLDESVEFLGRSLLGISLECARCHDHKFDPISQRDYYALLGFFQSSWYAPVPVAAASRAEADEAVTEYRSLVSENARLNGFIRQAGIKLNVGGGGRVKKWQQSRPEILAPVDKRLREIEIAVVSAELAAARDAGSTKLAADIRTTLLELEEKLLNHRPPVFDLRTFKQLNYFIGGHKSQIGLIERARDLKQDELVVELDRQLEYWNTERDQWTERSRYGGYAKTDPEVAELVQADERIAEIAALLVANIAQPWTAPKETHRYVRADGGLRRAEDLEPLDEADGLKFNSNNPDRVWLHPHYVGDARLLLRGDVLYPDELIPRGAPEFFASGAGLQPASHNHQQPNDPPDSGRLQLANWLTAPDSTQSALVARTAVNRVWQNLFGEGLCRTPKELGRLGERPELPELIDGLATRFVAEGWSLKQLIREIVLSDAYRRSSVVSDEEYEKDPENRIFARHSVRRLEYEPILNTMAGLLTGQSFAPTSKLNAADYAQHFDRPTVYDLVDRRSASISATQALFLMNNSGTTRKIAAEVATRQGFDKHTELDDVLDTIYAAILHRPPTDEERTFAKAFVTRRRQQDATSTSTQHISEFITLLLCGNEFLYIE
ncbi:PSD1 and planctomycete cytochrome C domain-containing protein [Novipirellula artificiosorum]|uniref:Planctomycete cytochrome C n=1 Tax=Novipirellula artificiosorum TaxID=2528016 RepID=A0A5C6DW61_9BACT|nr:PSD1 and planctomycete cytochrome C domain-containing protein [Novipirellula artificiosorum]TWU40585.1 Planctomycete cytochrome C [Novipirellula artificiosorum]